MTVATLRRHLPTVHAIGPILAALRESDPVRWRRAVRAVLRDAGSRQLAAEACGVARRTLDVWIEREPGLVDGLELPSAGRPRAG